MLPFLWVPELSDTPATAIHSQPNLNNYILTSDRISLSLCTSFKKAVSSQAELK
jgi:hypothetical protein